MSFKANNLNEKFLKKFDDLVNEGSTIISRCNFGDREGGQWIPWPQEYTRWLTESLNLVKRVCGEKSDHYLNLHHYMDDENVKDNPYYMRFCYGILQAAFNDYKQNMLFDVRQFVRAELLDDFLSQAEYLLNEEYHCAAASLAGAVLEDTLRKLCDKNNIEYEKKTKIDVLNISLAQKEIYDKTIQKRITLYADIRNNADHGHFQKVKKEDVDDMIKWLTRFIEEHMRT